MIYKETYYINGRSFTKTWSDTGFVARDGVSYDEANDPTELGRTYEEVSYPEGYDEMPAEEVVSRLEEIL